MEFFLALALLVYCLYFGIKLLVGRSQERFLKRFAPKDDGFGGDELESSREYALAKEGFLKKELFAEGVLFLFWIFAGFRALSELLGSDSIFVQTSGVILFLLIGFLFESLLSYARTFGIDKSFGFTASTPRLFFADKLKELLLTLIFGGLLSLAAIYFVSATPNWWLWVFGLISIFIVGANILYPNFIAPLFNKFEKLDDSELEAKLKELAKKSGFELDEMYRVDAGKRDTRLNAYFAGLGKTKRVALYDTLLAKLSKEEIAAVVAHELGHFKRGHIYQLMGVMFFEFFILTYLLGSLPEQFFEALGLTKNGGSIVAVFLLFSPVLMYLTMPFVNGIYKKNEFEADAYAAQMGLKEAMQSALRVLSSENKAFPYASKLKIFFDYTHPPITQRIERLKNFGGRC